MPLAPSSLPRRIGGFIVIREGRDNEQINRLTLRDIRHIANKKLHEALCTSVADDDLIKKAHLSSLLL
jgi:hypothetical protein